MSEKSRRKEIFKKLAHLIGGFVIFVKGFDKFTEHDSLIGIFLMLLGVIFVAFAFFHHKLPWFEKHEAWLLWLESLALGLITYFYFAEGKVALPFVYALCTIAYLVVGANRYRSEAIPK